MLACHRMKKDEERIKNFKKTAKNKENYSFVRWPYGSCLLTCCTAARLWSWAVLRLCCCWRAAVCNIRCCCWAAYICCRYCAAVLGCLCNACWNTWLEVEREKSEWIMHSADAFQEFCVHVFNLKVTSVPEVLKCACVIAIYKLEQGNWNCSHLCEQTVIKIMTSLRIYYKSTVSNLHIS